VGTKGSYSGGGGAAGEVVRDGLDDWLASLPGAGGIGAPAGNADGDPIAPGQPASNQTTSAVHGPGTASRVLPTIALFRAARGGGSSGDNRRTSGSARLGRSAATSARAAGRGAAAAYAYRTGDAGTLRDLGLDYEALRANPNIFDVANQIAQAACEGLPPGTIETGELLIVVGDLAGWLIEAGTPDTAPPLQQIAQEAVAGIMANAFLTETAAKLNEKGLTPQARAAFEHEIRSACEELTAQADLSPAGPTPAEFTTAIERGLDYLRSIYEGGA
jgi:hypothetical protein